MLISRSELNICQYKLGAKIKSVRETKGLSQLDVASMCSFEKTTISRIENGRTNVTLKTLIVLALVMEVELKDFFDFDLRVEADRGV